MHTPTVAEANALDTSVAIPTLKIAWPGANFGAGLGLANQLARPTVIFRCNDSVPPTTFILAERIDQLHWMVRYLMPLGMGSAQGKAHIADAMLREHARVKFLPTTECFARLDRGSSVERVTRDAFKTLLGSNIRTISNAKGIVADEIFMSASAIATVLGIVLP